MKDWEVEGLKITRRIAEDQRIGRLKDGGLSSFPKIVEDQRTQNRLYYTACRPSSEETPVYIS